MQVALLYNKFFDYHADKLLVGGVETYLYNLARLVIELGHTPVIFQWSTVPFIKTVDDISVIGVPLLSKPRKRRNALLFRHVTSLLNDSKDLLIFGADHVSVKTKCPRHISIQHGVSWDLPIKYLSTRSLAKYRPFGSLIKRRNIRQYKKYFENCHKTVCVDYNFLNWYRTITCDVPASHKIWVIPNFSELPSHSAVLSRTTSIDNRVKILYARRFVEMRGTRIFAKALKSILAQHSEIQCTFAGEGPDETWLRSQFADDDRVIFTKYHPSETLKVHLEHDIAVIPSLASEGTSLSVAEALACGCVVLATSVGGITNMIIDGFNGILAMPNCESLQNQLDMLITDAGLRRKLSLNAFSTASDSFSLDRWKSSWRQVILDTANQ